MGSGHRVGSARRLHLRVDDHRHWQLETDVEKASRVTVSFTAEGDRTRVIVVHKDFWRLAEGGQGMADAVGGADGWGSGLKQFAEFAAR